jgi:hypothetical protein
VKAAFSFFAGLPTGISLFITSHIKVQVVDFVEIYDFLEKNGRNLGFSSKSILF